MNGAAIEAPPPPEGYRSPRSPEVVSWSRLDATRTLRIKNTICEPGVEVDDAINIAQKVSI